MRLSPKTLYELDSLEAIAVLVDRGIGVSLVPDWLPPWPEGLSLKKIPLTDAPSRNIGVIFPRLTASGRLVQGFAHEALGAATAKSQRYVRP